MNVDISKKIHMYFGGKIKCKTCGKCYKLNHKKEVVSLGGFILAISPLAILNRTADADFYVIVMLCVLMFISGFLLIYKSQKMVDFDEVAE